jgi:general nucleoside transport system ATP-binding protein
MGGTVLTWDKPAEMRGAAMDARAAAVPVLEARQVSKSFGPVEVLSEVSLTLLPGEVHAVIGENGAGKSTLMNIVTGVYAPEGGRYLIDGAPAGIRGPKDALKAGIGMVHQHFRLVDRFTVAENVLLAAGQLGLFSNAGEAGQAVVAAGTAVGLAVDPAAIVGSLSVAERQRVEILKVLALGARIVILDEPTAVLTDQEATALLAAIRKIAQQGRAVVMITHKLREVAGHSDRVTIMRAGRTVVSGVPVGSLTADELGRLMMGEGVSTAEAAEAGVVPAEVPMVPVDAEKPGEERLIVSGLYARAGQGGVDVTDVSFRLRAGEILGIAGVGGNGQQALAEAIVGLLPVAGGALTLDGWELGGATVARRRDLGLRVVPSDRFASALIGELSVADNLALTRVRTGRYRSRLGAWLVGRRRMKQEAEAAISAFAIAGATPGRRSRLLSGGNAQKLLLARELDSAQGGVRLLVAHSPTRGLDVKACAFVHGAIRQAVAAGAACLLISEDVEEVRALSSRIVVMSAGRLVGELPAGASATRIGALILGDV